MNHRLLRRLPALAALRAAATLLSGGCVPRAAPYSPTGLWTDATAVTIGATLEYTNKVELADINGARQVDILFANRGNFIDPCKPEASRAYLNQGPGQPFQDVSQQVFGPATILARVIRVRDVSGDSGHSVFPHPRRW